MQVSLLVAIPIGRGIGDNHMTFLLKHCQSTNHIGNKKIYCFYTRRMLFLDKTVPLSIDIHRVNHWIARSAKH